MAADREHTVDGVRVIVLPTRPLRAYPLALRVGRILAGGLGRLDMASLRTGRLDGASLLAVVELLQTDEALVPDLLQSVRVVHNDEFVDLDSSDKINKVFAGKMMTMVRVAVKAAATEYGDFFADVFSGSADAETETPSATTEAPTASP